MSMSTTKELRATKYCEESVKSEPEQGPKSKRLKSVSEKKHDEDSYEEDKRDLTKEEEKSEEEEEEDNWEKGGKSEEEDSEYSDYEEYWSKYENDESQPFMYKRRSDGLVIKNRAWLDREAKIREYRELTRDLSEYDATPHPPGVAGGIVPLHLDENVLPILEKLCKVALNNQAPTFVFHNVVKCTHPAAATDLSAGRVYYITFQATEIGKPDLTTFQTHVVQHGDDVDVIEFLIKT